MNVLWITNIPFGKLLDLAGLTQEHASGRWLMAALKAFCADNRFHLTIVTVGRVKTVKTVTDGNITYCYCPGGFPEEYDHTTKGNLEQWEYVRETFKPDIIHLWGTEYTHGYLALKAMPGVASVVYIQGLLESISRYYLAGMTWQELIRSITIRDLLKRDWIIHRQSAFARKSHIEANILNISGHVIVENRWCASHCLNINPNCSIHQCNLPICDEFFKVHWTTENVEPFTIMSNAAGHTIKGLHILIKALGLVVHNFPKAKLVIPGSPSPFERSFLERTREDGYTKYVRTLITSLHLEDSVLHLGRLSSEQMAKQMSVANVFVVPSSIENHSSTLIEAMIVGTPCVASYVGGIPEIVTHNENGLLYRFEEFEMLAQHISNVFSDLAYASRLGNNAKASMRNGRSSEELKSTLVAIYENIIYSKAHQFNK